MLQNETVNKDTHPPGWSCVSGVRTSRGLGQFWDAGGPALPKTVHSAPNGPSLPNGPSCPPNGPRKTSFLDERGCTFAEWTKISHETRSIQPKSRSLQPSIFLSNYGPFSRRMDQDPAEWTKVPPNGPKCQPNGPSFAEWTKRRMDQEGKMEKKLSFWLRK